MGMQALLRLASPKLPAQRQNRLGLILICEAGILRQAGGKRLGVRVE